MSEELDNFQWVFKISEVVNFEETTITVYANTYKQAVKKIRNLKLPSLERFTDIDENLKLESVYEVKEDLNESEEEFEEKDTE